MSSDIYAMPDFSKKVRYNSKVEEDGTGWVEKEVDIYDNPDSIEEEQSDFQPQEGGPHTLNRPPVPNKSFRSAALCLGVLCLLLMVGIITLSTGYILVTLEKNDLEKKLNNLSPSFNQSQDLIKQLQVTKEKELQSRIDNLTKSYNELQDKMSHTSVTNSQLQDEIKQLKDKIEGMLCPGGWKRFGFSCYFKSTEKKSWSESRKDCENRGSDLVIINSKEEQDFVTELNQHEESWIGLWTQWSKTARKYQWEWVDGSQPTETFWATGEKHHTGYYVAYCDQQGRWRNEHYHDRNWICENKTSCFL